MSKKRPKPEGHTAVWKEFTRRHRGNHFLEENPLYSLSESLIAAIEDEEPRFFEEGQADFERDLARVTGGGSFFHGRPAPCLLLVPPTADGHQADNDEKIREMLTQEMGDAGRSRAQIEKHFAAEEERQKAVDLREAAYAGWLVGDPRFREERDNLRVARGEQVAAWGGFPSHRHSFLGEPWWSPGPQPAPVVRKKGWSSERWRTEVATANAPFVPFLLFFRRWGLDTFLTWDLPVPMRPELYGVVTRDTSVLQGPGGMSSLADAGVNLFLPWYSLADKGLSLHDFAGPLRTVHNPDHLDGWLSPKKGDVKELGYVRLRRALMLYRYRELVLARRYADRLDGNVEKLDRAFARFMDIKIQSVRISRIYVKIKNMK